MTECMCVCMCVIKLCCSFLILCPRGASPWSQIRHRSPSIINPSSLPPRPPPLAHPVKVEGFASPLRDNRSGITNEYDTQAATVPRAAHHVFRSTTTTAVTPRTRGRILSTPRIAVAAAKEELTCLFRLHFVHPCGLALAYTAVVDRLGVSYRTRVYYTKRI